MVIGAALGAQTGVLMSHNPLDACTSGPLMQTAECLTAEVLHTNFQLGKPPSVHIMVCQMKNSSVPEHGLVRA